MSASLLHPQFPLGRWLWLFGGLFLASVVAAGVERTQSLQLRAGWNAVHLEVQPARATSDHLFGELPVDTVACFFPGRLEGHYLRDPGDAPWREEGWGVWYASHRPESALSTLREIHAPRALLIKATADFTWTVTGPARPATLVWHADTCTFTGLPVDPEQPPTFAQFFDGSVAHRRLRIFRLEQDIWKLVRQPNTDRPRSGEAYWIDTDGASRFQGPLRLSLPPEGALNFDQFGAARSLELVNDSQSGNARVRIQTFLGLSGLPLRQLRRDPTTFQTARGAWPATFDLPALSPGESAFVRLEPDRAALTESRGDALLRISDGRGTVRWVPVSARRSDAVTVVPQP